jgi:hypothetical protein
MPRSQPPNPPVSWSFDLPDKLKLAIADCITLYSKMESCVVELIWELEQADLPRKQEVARTWGDKNFRVVKKAVNSLPGVETDAIWPALKMLTKERNLIGHGVWMMADDGRPLVVWHAKFLESNDWVGAEYFDWPRFDRFLISGRVLVQTFADFKALLQDGFAEEKAALAAARAGKGQLSCAKDPGGCE